MLANDIPEMRRMRLEAKKINQCGRKGCKGPEKTSYTKGKGTENERDICHQQKEQKKERRQTVGKGNKGNVKRCLASPDCCDGPGRC